MSRYWLEICAVAGVAGVAAVTLGGASDASAGTPVSAAAIRRSGAIDIDGKLDEPAWAQAPVSSGFWQRFPDEGKAPEQATEFRVLYDDAALYVGVRAHDVAPERIRRLLTRRDEMSPSDWIMVGVDSYHDRRTAFVFGLNAAGVQRDWLVFDDLNEDTSWDAVWTASAKVDDTGWCAEFRIPLSQLRFSTEPEQHWGLQVARVVGRTGEQDYWSPMPKAENRTVSLFGTLDGMRGVKPGRRLELLPYVSGGAALGTLDESDPFDQSAAARGSVGVDVRYGLGSAFTLSASINPDFGQVEADPSQVNLSAHELFFPEKRPFFLEGSDIFQFGLGQGDDNSETLFYTRRIGAPPHGEPSGDYIDTPSSTTIYGAAKVSGKAAGWSIGVLDAVTAQETARVDLGGMRSTPVVEPLTNFALARVKRDFFDGSTSVGAVMTAVNRSLDGTGLAAELHDHAYTGGAEVRHRFGHDAWNLSAKLTGTYVHGDPAAIEADQLLVRHLYQRPDADYVHLDPTRTSLSGLGFVADFGRNGATENWRWALGTDNRSPGFEANDLGFQPGADNHVGWYWIQYRDDKPGDHVLGYQVNTNGWAWGDYGNQLDGYGGNVNGNIQFVNHWGGFLGINTEQVVWDLAALRGGPALRGNRSYGLNLNVNSDDRAKVQAYAGLHLWGQPTTGSSRNGGEAGVTIQARPNITVFLGPSVQLVTDDAQYVDEVPDGMGTSHYIFARIHEVVTGLTVRGNWTLSPRLSVQAYAQPFIAAGDYRQYREADDPHASRYADRFHELVGNEIAIDRDNGVATVDRNGDGVPDYAFGLGDFNFRQLRSNVVVRWEYLPGSTAFLIWSHGQTDDSSDGRFGTGGVSRGLAGLFDAPSEDVIMLKVNYWVGL